MTLVNPTYCTQADIEVRYRSEKLAELTGDPDGIVVNANEVDKAILDYASHMNAYLRLRFDDLEAIDEHPLLNALNVEGAWLTLRKWQPHGLSDDERLAWERLEKQLKWLADGTLFLSAEQADAQAGEFRANPRLFGRARAFPETTFRRVRG